MLYIVVCNNRDTSELECVVATTTHVVRLKTIKQSLRWRHQGRDQPWACKTWHLQGETFDETLSGTSGEHTSECVQQPDKGDAFKPDCPPYRPSAPCKSSQFPPRPAAPIRGGQAVERPKDTGCKTGWKMDPLDTEGAGCSGCRR